MRMTLPTIMWDQVGRGKGLPYCTGVSAWFGCLWHALYTHNLCWATANKGQGFARHRIGGVPKVCLFYQPRSIFFCDVNFFSSRNNLSEFSVPVQYALLLVKTFGDMYIYYLCNISMLSQFFMYLYFWTKIFIQNSQYFLVHSWNVLPAII